MTGNYLELAIIAFILLSMFYLVWRGGQANPESTGDLGRRMGRMEGKMTTISSELGTLDKRMGELDRRAVTVTDMARLEGAVAAHEHRFDDMAGVLHELRAAIGEHKSTSEHTRRQVDRLYDFIVEKGLK